MQSITLTAIVDENGHLVVDVPPEIPPGPVEVVIRSVAEIGEMTRNEVRARLKAARLLEDDEPSSDAREVSDKELERLATIFASDRPISELIDEDREDRW